MGWLIAAIFCGLEAMAGLIVTIIAIKESIVGGIFSLIVTAFFGYLTHYFMKRYKGYKDKKDNPSKVNDVIETEKIQTLYEEMPIIEGSPLFLNGDTLHYLESARLQITKNKAIGRTGSSGGLSIRLAKGVHARTGSYGGQTVYGDVVSNYDGQLAVTNTRILFIHQEKGFEIKLKDLSLIEPYSDGVSIQTKSKSYALLFQEPRYFMELINRINEESKSTY